MRDALGRIESLLVLGGNSEIGIATAQALVRRGTSRIVLAARNRTAADRSAESLLRAGALSVSVEDFDAGMLESHDGWVRDIFDRHGDLDAAILAFGVLGDQSVAPRDVALAREIVTVNYLASVSFGIPLVRCLESQGHGTIILLSTVAAERPRPSNFVYGSAKAGADAFWRGMSYRLQKEGIHVLIVRPGFVTTKMTAGLKPPPFSTTPQAVAEAVVSALQTRKHLVWIPSTLRWVMVAVRYLPRSVFARLRI